MVNPNEGETNTTIKYVFVDGSVSFGDTGFSLGAHVSKKENSGNYDLNIIEFYPRYTFESVNGWTPGLEFGYKSEVTANSDFSGSDSEKFKIRPWISGNITENVSLFSEFIYEDNIKNDWHLYELYVEPAFKLTDSTKVGFGLKYGEESKDNGDKNFSKYFAKLFVNHTFDSKWSGYGVLEYENLDFSDKEVKNKDSIKPILGASYGLTSHLNAFGEVSYKWEKQDDYKGRITFFKAGLGYNW